MKPWRDDARRGPGGLDTPDGPERATSTRIERMGVTATATRSMPTWSRTRNPRCRGSAERRDRRRRPRRHRPGCRNQPGRLAGDGRREPGRRQARAIPRASCRRPGPSSEPAAVLDEVELAILAVPDDAISSVDRAAAAVQRPDARPHQRPARGRSAEPARAAGSQIGAFHPLVSFTSDVERSVAAIQGATIALEGDDRLMSLLADLAEAIGGVPVRLPRGLQGRLPRRRGPGFGRTGRPAGRHCDSRRNGRPGRAGCPGRLRPAHRADPRQRPRPSAWPHR